MRPFLGRALVAASACIAFALSSLAQGNTLTVPLAPELLPQSTAVTITGTLAEGPECPALRTDDGRVFSLVINDRAGTHDGDHVRVSGRYAQASVCMTDKSIIVDHIEATAASDIRAK